MCSSQERVGLRGVFRPCAPKRCAVIFSTDDCPLMNPLSLPQVLVPARYPRRVLMRHPLWSIRSGTRAPAFASGVVGYTARAVGVLFTVTLPRLTLPIPLTPYTSKPFGNYIGGKRVGWRRVTACRCRQTMPLQSFGVTNMCTGCRKSEMCLV